MKPLSKNDLTQLLAEARVGLRLRSELRYVPSDIADWEDRDFLVVTNRSRSEGVLILPLETLVVMPFRLQNRTANAAGRVEAIICDICATWQRGSNSAVIGFQKSGGSVSFLCCADLDCSLHVRNKTAAATLSRTQLYETNTTAQRVERLRYRLRRIVQAVGE